MDGDVESGGIIVCFTRTCSSSMEKLLGVRLGDTIRCTCMVGGTSLELDMVTFPDIEEQAGQATLIWRAVELPLYSVAVIPFTVGNHSLSETGVVNDNKESGVNNTGRRSRVRSPAYGSFFFD